MNNLSTNLVVKLQIITEIHFNEYVIMLKFGKTLVKVRKFNKKNFSKRSL